MSNSSGWLLRAGVWATAVLLQLFPATAAEPGAEPGAFLLSPPFWGCRKMEGEPVLFIQQEGTAVASGRLLFTPASPPRVTHPDGIMTYVDGKDYVWKPGSNVLELTASSRIPFKTSAQMVPPAGSPNTLGGVLFSESHFFHDLQVQVSYEHDEIWPAPPEPAVPQLPRSVAKLNAKKPFKIVALGDSITEGYNASGFQKCKAPPYQPPYPQLVANALQRQFATMVACANLGKAGTKADWGLGMVDKVSAEKGDLIILAFGMNHSEPADAFGAVMGTLLEAVQKGSPDADVVLVASMISNPRGGKREHFLGYRDALRGLEQENVALADVTAPWLEIQERKPFSDLTGNNINHPNDFGHRLYAWIISGLLSSRSPP